MKYILFLLVLFSFYLVTISQDIVDPPTLPINFNNPAVFDRIFGDTCFVKGWSCGDWGRELDEALFMNYYILKSSAAMRCI